MKDPFLMSLLEAPGDPTPPQGIEDPFAVTTDSPTDQPAAEPNAASPTGGGDDMGMADPFADPAAGGADPAAGMDMNNNPDGLPGPDATGSANLDSFSGADEKNLQVKIIQATNLERSLLKSKIFDKFKDLYNKLDVYQANMDHNQTIVDPKIREKVTSQLQDLAAQISKYLEYKFTPNNYEENLKNYMVFSKKFTEIIDFSLSGTKDEDSQVTGKL